VPIADIILFGTLGVLFLIWSMSAGHWQAGLTYNPPWLDLLHQVSWGPKALIGALVGLAAAAHFSIRRVTARRLTKRVRTRAAASSVRGDLVGAFERNTVWSRSLLSTRPLGWDSAAQRRVEQVLQNCDSYIQKLNDRFTNPSGHAAAGPGRKSAVRKSAHAREK
jgi:hypothetical protein